MKDGRTHLAHKAEHAVDLETGAIVGVTVQGADQGDTGHAWSTSRATITPPSDDHVPAGTPHHRFELFPVRAAEWAV